MKETVRRVSPRTNPAPWHVPLSSGSKHSAVEIEVLSTAVSEVANEVTELQIHLRRLVDAFSEQADSIQYRSTMSPARFCASRDDEHLPALQTGSTIGPYRVLGFLGAGGMGEVYRAVDERLDRTVAIKVLPDRLSRDPVRRERLRQEARLLSSISHPHICTLFDVGYQTGRDFLVMEYLEGRTLGERLADSPLQLQDALHIGLDVADALAAAHSIGIVHRDLKPSNIMLTGPTDSSPGVKLLDFGLARAFAEVDSAVERDSDESTTRTLAPGLEGTLPYMAPEQFDDRGSDGRADIWALGVILYEMVCGRRPFGGKNPAAIIGSVLHSRPTAPAALSSACSADLSRIIERCMAKNQEQRWPTCGDLAEQVRRDNIEGQLRRDSKPRIVGPRRLLSRLKITAAAVSTLLALGSLTAAKADPLSRITSATGRELESREDSLLHVGREQAAVTWWVDNVEMMELDRRNLGVHPPATAKSQIRGILARRDRILEVFDARIAELGAEKVIRDEPGWY